MAPIEVVPPRCVWATVTVPMPLAFLMQRRTAAAGSGTAVQVFQILFFAVIVYFMTGYQASFSKFAVYYAVFAMFALISETVGHLCAIVTKTSHNGECVPALFVQIFDKRTNYVLPDDSLMLATPLYVLQASSW